MSDGDLVVYTGTSPCFCVDVYGSPVKSGGEREAVSGRLGSWVGSGKDYCRDGIPVLPLYLHST